MGSYGMLTKLNFLLFGKAVKVLLVLKSGNKIKFGAKGWNKYPVVDN